MTFSTRDALVPPVSEQEVIDFARLDDDDQTVRGSLIAATSIVVSFLKRDLINRNYNFRINNFYEGKYDRGIYSSKKVISLDVNLPMANLFEITEVKIVGEISTEYTAFFDKQAFIKLNSMPVHSSDKSDIEVSYVAGYGYSKDDVPEDIKQAVIMLAAHLNLNRGCSPSNALEMSGAKAMLAPHAVMGGFVI